MLRHAAATVQHHQYGVPLEALAEAMGHTLTASGEAPEATRYYSQMTETQKAEIRHDTILAIMDDARLAVRVIDPEEDARADSTDHGGRRRAHARGARTLRWPSSGDLRTLWVPRVVRPRHHEVLLPWVPFSSCVDPSTLTESTSSSTAISRPPTRTNAWATWPALASVSV